MLVASGIALLGGTGWVAFGLWRAHALWGALAFTPREALAADRVLVLKRRGELVLTRDGTVIGRYPVALGRVPEGAKQREGDGRTPEGRYVLDWRRLSPVLGPAIHVSYPSPADRARAARAGVDPGGGIMLHALSGDLPWTATPPRRRGWTEGCIGLPPRAMRAVWYAIADGTPIEIRD
ncbi:MAG: murein L,D-transpeptidase family protein [Alphaproteobacteria bacterium]